MRDPVFNAVWKEIKNRIRFLSADLPCYPAACIDLSRTVVHNVTFPHLQVILQEDGDKLNCDYFLTQEPEKATQVWHEELELAPSEASVFTWTGSKAKIIGFEAAANAILDPFTNRSFQPPVQD